MRSNFLIQRWRVTLLVVALVAIVIAVYFAINSSESEVAVSVPTVTPPPKDTPIPTATSVSASSPISPLSPLKLSNTPIPDSLEELRAMTEKGVAIYEQGDYEAAIEIFDEVLAKTSNAITYNARGSAYLALGNYEQALDDYTKATELDSTFPHSFYNRGRLLGILQRYDEALEDLQQAIQLAPLEFGYRANGNIGLIYYKMGEYDKALEAFEKSISYNQDERADIYYFRGETYTALENYEAAIADYRAAIERFTQYAEAYQSLGYAYYKTGQFDQALESLNQALEIASDSPIAHLYLALVYLAIDQPDEALSAASQGADSMDILPKEEQEAISTRVLANLETIAQEQPDRAETVDAIIDLIPAQ